MNAFITVIAASGVYLLLVSACLAGQGPAASSPINRAPGPWIDRTIMPAPGDPDPEPGQWEDTLAITSSNGISDEQCKALVDIYFKMSPDDRQLTANMLLECIVGRDTSYLPEEER